MGHGGGRRRACLLRHGHRAPAAPTRRRLRSLLRDSVERGNVRERLVNTRLWASSRHRSRWRERPSVRVVRRGSTSTREKFFFLGCNNVTPTTNTNGTVAYTVHGRHARRSPASRFRRRPGAVRIVVCSSTSKALPTSQRSVFNGKLQKLIPARSTSLAVQEKRLDDLHEPDIQEPGSVRKFTGPR